MDDYRSAAADFSTAIPAKARIHMVSDNVVAARAPLRRMRIWARTAWALRAQLGAVYVFGGIANLNADWLLSAQPMRIWLGNSADAALVGPLLAETWVAYAMSWSGAAFDLAIVGALMWSRTRPAAYAALVAFHLATWLLFPRIGMFPWIMICLRRFSSPRTGPSPFAIARRGFSARTR